MLNARQMGLRGAKARVRATTSEQRKEWARKAARASARVRKAKRRMRLQKELERRQKIA